MEGPNSLGGRTKRTDLQGRTLQACRPKTTLAAGKRVMTSRTRVRPSYLAWVAERRRRLRPTSTCRIQRVGFSVGALVLRRTTRGTHEPLPLPIPIPRRLESLGGALTISNHSSSGCSGRAIACIESDSSSSSGGGRPRKDDSASRPAASALGTLEEKSCGKKARDERSAEGAWSARTKSVFHTEPAPFSLLTLVRSGRKREAYNKGFVRKATKSEMAT